MFVSVFVNERKRIEKFVEKSETNLAPAHANPISDESIWDSQLHDVHGVTTLLGSGCR